MGRSGELVEPYPGRRLPLGVRIGIGRDLHGLCRLGHRHRLPARNIEQTASEALVRIAWAAEEESARVYRIGHLGGSAPPGAWPLLEQAQRVAVAPVQVAKR